MKLFLLATLLVLVGLGCRQEDRISPVELKRWSGDMERRIAATEFTSSSNLLAFTETLLLAQQSQIQALSNRVTWLMKHSNTRDDDALDWVSIDVTKPNYQICRTKIGPILISVKDTAAYLDGYRVTLEIGNPTAADLPSAKLHIRTSASAFSIEELQKYNDSVELRVEDITATLKAGYWTTVTFTLSPATAERLRNLFLALEPQAVYLRKQP